MKLNRLILLLLSACGFTHGFNPLIFIQNLFFPKIPVVKRVRSLDVKGMIYSESAILDFIGLVERHGYPGEEHNVTTPDGYHITIHRIPSSPRMQRSNGKVIFLQHGLLTSSDSWVIRDPDDDLAFLLADAGYDVWLGNLRGNYYGRSHETLKPSDPAFWQFSFHEHGFYDLPAMIDYVLKHTGVDKLHYLGHSMGTTMLFVMLSTRPHYNNKIKLGINFAPVAYWSHNKSPVLPVLVKSNEILHSFIVENQINEVGPLNFQVSRTARVLCDDKSITQSFCVAILFVAAGVDVPQLNTSALINFMSYNPAGTSLKCLLHYRQHILSNKFTAYDYGPEENLLQYGQREPPEYNLKNVVAPMALYYATNDALSDMKDVAELKEKLSNVVIYERVPYKLFNHLDYVWAIDSKKILYDLLIRQIQPY